MKSGMLLVAMAVCGLVLPTLKAEPDPELTIPFCAKAPLIDGKLDDEAWKGAARLEMLEAFPCGVPRAMRAEPVDLLCDVGCGEPLHRHGLQGIQHRRDRRQQDEEGFHGGRRAGTASS